MRMLSDLRVSGGRGAEREREGGQEGQRGW